jgi:hypothetical protein
MSTLYDVLVGLSSVHDAEMLDGYRRYESLVATILTPEQLEAYAESIRQSGTIRIFEELTPDELASLTPEERAIALVIRADENISMENRRVVALLHQRGQDAVAPDRVSSSER